MTLTDTQREAIATRVIAGEHPANIAHEYGKRVAPNERQQAWRVVWAYAKRVQMDFCGGEAHG